MPEAPVSGSQGDLLRRLRKDSQQADTISIAVFFILSVTVRSADPGSIDWPDLIAHELTLLGPCTFGCFAP